MKTLIAALTFLSLSNPAQAIMAPGLFSPNVLVKSVRVEGDFMPPVPVEARPVHTFTIELKACRTVSAQELVLNVENVESVMGRRRPAYAKVHVTFKRAFMDCFGPTHSQEIELSTQEIPLRAQVQLVNSLLVEDNTTH